MEQLEEMVAPTERMPAIVLPRPQLVVGGEVQVIPHRPRTDPTTLTPIPLVERTWLELAPYERDELVAAHVDRWSAEDGPVPRYSQEYRLALSLVKRMHANPYYRSLLGTLLFPKLCHRLGFTEQLPKSLEVEAILCALEPIDIAWAYLEAYGQAPAYGGQIAPEDTFLL